MVSRFSRELWLRYSGFQLGSTSIISSVLTGPPGPSSDSEVKSDDEVQCGIFLWVVAEEEPHDEAQNSCMLMTAEVPADPPICGKKEAVSAAAPLSIAFG